MSQQDKAETAKYFYRASTADFMKIPGSPVAYWVSNKVRELFSGRYLGEFFDTEGQNKTTDNEKYLRYHWEVSHERIGKDKKWVRCAKGGTFRKWDGNVEHIIDWSPETRAFYRKDHSARIVEERFWYLEGITWTDITSSSTAFRYLEEGCTYETAGPTLFVKGINKYAVLAYLNTKIVSDFIKIMNPTFHAKVKDIRSLPVITSALNLVEIERISKRLIETSKNDWNSYESSLSFTIFPLLNFDYRLSNLMASFKMLRAHWQEITLEVQRLEVANNSSFIDTYGLQDELTPDVPLEEITLTCNPHYRYGSNKSDEELETTLQCDTIKELVSYAIGCMMGRFSLDKPGLILASHGETLQDYLRQITEARFVPDDDGILPLTDQEWFTDDATNRFRELVRTAWGEQTLQENLDFVAESLCLHAIKPKKGEDSLDAIRRYLSTQFYKDHLRTYKKRPIYWLFSSGRYKAFECLVYLHRYNEGTLARMRTEYVIPLTAKLNAHANKLEKDIDASSSTAEKKALEKQMATLHNQQAELATFDEKLRHFADQRIHLDLDDGVKVNYGKFGNLLAEVNAITGDSQ